jgi:prepilin-type N-terminal cleavage/methylation domain-containing protein
MRNDERGFSMVELLVTMTVMGVIAAAILSFMINTTALTTRASADVTTEQDAQLALRRMTQDLRGATAIAPCSGVSYGSCVTFSQARPYSSTASCAASDFRYELVGTTVQENRTNYSATCVATVQMTNGPVLSNVSNGSTPLFTYYDGAGNVIDTASSPCGVTPTTSCTVPAATSVKVTMIATYPVGTTTSSLTFTSVAAFRNNRT